MSKLCTLHSAKTIGQHFEIREWFHTVQKQVSRFGGVMYILSIWTVVLGITRWSYVLGL